MSRLASPALSLPFTSYVLAWDRPTSPTSSAQSTTSWAKRWRRIRASHLAEHGVSSSEHRCLIASGSWSPFPSGKGSGSLRPGRAFTQQQHWLFFFGSRVQPSWLQHNGFPPVLNAAISNLLVLALSMASSVQSALDSQPFADFTASDPVTTWSQQHLWTEEVDANAIAAWQDFPRTGR